MDIQWYPGHMAKAKRLLQTQLSKVDLVIELCDARLPLSSRNPALNAMVNHKRRILLLCKADLAENGKTQAWLSYFKKQGIDCMAYDATPGRTKQARAFIEQAARAVIERGERRGMNKVIRAMVIGVPNVGKSTFINRLYGGSVAETGDRPGVTKSNRWVKVSGFLEVLDTPGMLWPKLNDQRAATRLAYIGTIRDAVYNQEELCVNLLEDLLALRREETIQRYKIKNPDAEGYALLEEVCRGRGFLMKGGVLDTERGCSVVLDEFRAGKVGKLTLETVPEQPKAQTTTQETAGDGENG